jgi:hypothetical protein
MLQFHVVGRCFSDRLTTDPIRFKNVKILGKSMREGVALVEFEDHAGPGVIDNCKIMNHLDRPVVYAAAKVVGGPSNIMLRNSLVGGSSPQPVTDINERPQSRVSHTCITIPNAGPDDIKGAAVGKGVSFGKCTGKSGLSKPKKVGSGGNISSLPIPDNPSSGTPAPATPDFSERNPGILGGIANWFEDTVQAFKNTIQGFAKMVAIVVFGPLIALAVVAMLFFGVLLVVLLFLAAGLKALKE